MTPSSDKLPNMRLADEGPTQVERMRAVAHPVRLEMLSLLTGATLSAAEVARELDLTQANASYHLRRLLAAGLLVLDGEEKVNGGTAKRYRHPWDVEEVATGPVDESDRLAGVRTMSEAVPRRFRKRLRGEQQSPMLFSDIDTWVEPQVWAEAMDLARRASHLLHASAQAPRTEGTVRGTMSIAAFQMGEDR